MIVAYILFAFALVQLMVAMLNYFVRPSLRKSIHKDVGLVSVLIPARNEENNIIALLSDLQHQNYNNLEIIVYNDGSTDRTAEYVGEMAKHDPRIQLIGGETLPEGWLGKNHACHHLAQIAKGKYLLFLDADVRLDENALGVSMRYFHKRSLALLSFFPKQIMNSLGERAVVPIMNFILVSLLPLFLVRKSHFSSLAAANGQFMLFDAKTYNKLKPHEQFKANKVEDIAIARYFKKKKKKIACLLGTDSVRCQMYGNYKEAINGFSKNIVSFFGGSFLVAIMFWAITSLSVFVVFAFLPMAYFVVFCAIILATRYFISAASHQNIGINMLLIIPQQINIILIIIKSAYNKYIRGAYEWKGRAV